MGMVGAMTPRHLWLDHSIVGQPLLSGFEFRKDRQYAFCRICGDIFQSRIAIIADDFEWSLDPALKLATAIETKEWQTRHARKHPDHVHKAFVASGRFLSPDAAHKLAPYGIAPVSDMILDGEIEHAVATSPRAPMEQVQS